MGEVSKSMRAFLLNSSYPEIVTEFLAPDAVLVPAPRSAPLASKDALWPARILCEALVRGGLGFEVLPCLVRTEAVRKSAYAGVGERPTPRRHYDTIRVELELLVRPARITVVDDIITKGATLLAAASRVGEAFPSADVRVFALVRTMGLVQDIEHILTPCRGRITYDGVSANRHP